jgi:hypothetical protein
MYFFFGLLSETVLIILQSPPPFVEGYLALEQERKGERETEKPQIGCDGKVWRIVVVSVCTMSCHGVALVYGLFLFFYFHREYILATFMSRQISLFIGSDRSHFVKQ